ncbi:Protein of uncharacterised function (DUF3793) [Peptoniphilus harei]|uniref:DUF3793 family protein n=1 Tax=Peptoniphilus harei TaxID=54005 RepID=UPI000F70436E|nr:DUF3793 family protein [Peptoniphilus harei]MDU1642786.1 DUF3793 family protein [Peptoniphilus harei]QQE47248.1 DUF3793 family protein [Peptoniphilus harei]VEJ34242.1 Protein of uncharacterised function (DUF3793) [Peptoniphilus harei]
MYDRVLIDFLNHINNFKDYDYILALIKSTVAPTFNDLKLGTMMNLRNAKRPLKDYWMQNKFILRDVLGLDFYELKEGEDFVLVYFFKNNRLEKKLSQIKIKDFLNSYGYISCVSTGDYLNLLSQRFRETCPDEIGIFLGYPLKDVMDFKDRDKKACKCTGYWKCFNNEKSSLEAFKRFDEVKLIEMRNILKAYNY